MFRPDWDRGAEVADLVQEYYWVLRRALRAHPPLQPCLTRCRHCRIYFLTHPRNAGRRDLRCPVGCREAHRKRQSTQRSVAYYQGEDGRKYRREQNGNRQPTGKEPVPNPPPEAQPEPPTRLCDPELLRRLYVQCEGWVQRMHEKLVAEEGLAVKYSTLTRRLRELGISTQPQERCQRVPDEPGAEMPHDTTVYRIPLGDQKVTLVASLLYLRYHSGCRIIPSGG